MAWRPESMMLLMSSLAFAGPSRTDSAVLLLTQKGGFSEVSVAPLEGKKGFFTWTGTKNGQSCRGGVQVERAHKRKPRGRFTSVCDSPYPDGRFSAEESCGETTGGTPIYVVWSLVAEEGRFKLDADGTQTMIRLTGAFRDGAMHVESGHLKDRIAFTLLANDTGWAATPDALALNCSDTLQFVPAE